MPKNILEIKNPAGTESNGNVSQQFKILENEALGDCLFLSVLDFLKRRKTKFKDIPKDSNELRLRTVEYIMSSNAKGFQSNFDRFQDSLMFNLQHHVPNILNYGTSESADKEIRHSYLQYMSTPGNYGTFTELCAMAEIFGFMGYMFLEGTSDNYSCYEFGFSDNETFDRRKPLAFLIFDGNIDHGHFRLLEPIGKVSPTSTFSGKYKVLTNDKSTNKQLRTTIKRVYVDSSELSPPSEVEISDNQSEVNVSKKAFTCDVCNQSFPTQRGMKVHRGRHANEANLSTAREIISNLKSSSKGRHASVSNSVPETTMNNEAKAHLDSECKRWEEILGAYEVNDSFDENKFDEDVTEFLKFMFHANAKMPGPKHPAIKFFRLRQKKKNTVTSAQYARSSNPQRTDAKTKQRRRDKYQYDLTQYWYYNQRRKAVLNVMKDGKTRKCQIKMEPLENHFKGVFQKSNHHIRDNYPSNATKNNVVLKPEDIQRQIKKISLDTSAGPDRVLARSLRGLNVARSICSIANTMLKTSFVPSSFLHGKLVLIDKEEDDVNDINNWRPITIYSVVRRAIEKSLEAILRRQVSININQRGFVIGIPGCHVNAKLINACLKSAKIFKRNCTIVFLDVSKAFDRIGHDHILKSLQAKGVSPNLVNLIMNLLTQNHVTISNGKDTSKNIDIKCGVPQGGPLSPLLFNIAIDYLYEEICDPQFVDKYGYKLAEEYDALGLAGFADDQAVAGKDEKSAIRLVEAVEDLLLKIGLHINPKKSQAIIIRQGKLVKDVLHLSNGSEISSIGEDERIKYLGCSFNSELIFDETCIERLNNKLTCLSTSALLKPDQKLNIINQYVFPSLTYPLQAAPLNKVPKYVTEGLDVMIRRTVKEIIGLPMHTNDNLFYSPRKLRGLGLVKTAWEIYLQHFAIEKRLSTIDDQLFQCISNCSEEMASCIQALDVQCDGIKTLRAALRQKSYEQWCNLKYQGVGVIHFSTHVKANDFVWNKNSLSSSEWTAAIKLNSNYANLNGVPGVESSSFLCRKCGKEKETISHVIGSCPSNNLLVTSRHHSAKHQLTEILRAKSNKCFEEVYAVDTDGRARFIDIVAFDPKSKKAYIIDPTIRYEASDTEQNNKICAEKSEIYEKCIPFLAEKYASEYGQRDWIVRGLWFGSRGTVGQSVLDFFNELRLDTSAIKDICENILVKSIHIINQHIYS